MSTKEKFSALAGRITELREQVRDLAVRLRAASETAARAEQRALMAEADAATMRRERDDAALRAAERAMVEWARVARWHESGCPVPHAWTMEQASTVRLVHDYIASGLPGWEEG